MALKFKTDISREEARKLHNEVFAGYENIFDEVIKATGITPADLLDMDPEQYELVHNSLALMDNALKMYSIMYCELHTLYEERGRMLDELESLSNKLDALATKLN